MRVFYITVFLLSIIGTISSQNTIVLPQQCNCPGGQDSTGGGFVGGTGYTPIVAGALHPNQIYPNCGNEYLLAVDNDGSDNLFFAGYYDCRFSVGAMTSPNVLTANSNQLYVVKTNSSGTAQWISTISSVTSTYSIIAKDVKFDNNGNVYIVGEYATGGTITFSSGISLPSTGGISYRDIFVAKLNANTGAWIWVRNGGGTQDGDRGNSIAISPNGAIISITGQVQYWISAPTFGSFPINGSNGQIGYVASLDPSGNWIWASSILHPSQLNLEVGNDLVFTTSGELYVTGLCKTGTQFGSITIPGTGNRAGFFVAKINSTSGTWVDSRFGISTQTGDLAVTISTDNSNNIYIGGKAAGLGRAANSDYYGGDETIWDGGGTAADSICPITGSSYSQTSFIAKMNSSFEMIWNKSISQKDGNLNEIDVDSEGNVYVVGTHFNPQYNFSYQFYLSQTGYTAWLAKYDSQGNFRSFLSGTASNTVNYMCEAVAALNNQDYVVYGGSFGNNLTFDHIHMYLYPTALHDYWLVKVNTAP